MGGDTESIRERECRLILPWLCTVGLFRRLNIGLDVFWGKLGPFFYFSGLIMQIKKKKEAVESSSCANES